MIFWIKQVDLRNLDSPFSLMKRSTHLPQSAHTVHFCQSAIQSASVFSANLIIVMYTSWRSITLTYLHTDNLANHCVKKLQFLFYFSRLNCRQSRVLVPKTQTPWYKCTEFFRQKNAPARYCAEPLKSGKGIFVVRFKFGSFHQVNQTTEGEPLARMASF